jgi:hypothetical protein
MHPKTFRSDGLLFYFVEYFSFDSVANIETEISVLKIL